MRVGPGTAEILLLTRPGQPDPLQDDQERFALPLGAMSLIAGAEPAVTLENKV